MEQLKKIKIFLLYLNKFFFFFIYLNYYYWRYRFFFLQKIISGIICFFYFLEYIFIILFMNNIFYALVVYKFIVKEKFVIFRNKRNIIKLKSNDIKSKKKNIKKVNSLVNWYYKKWMFYGFTVVYIQIFFRKIRELKYYLMYIFNNKFKRKYKYFKKSIVNYSSFFYYNNNYNLVMFFEYIKKRIFSIIIIFNYIKLYSIVNLKQKILLIILKKTYILFQLKNNIKKWI